MIRLGPHYVPQIPCKNCGTEHHIDATNGEYLGRCKNCSNFLRRPTEAEERQMADYVVWNAKHLERGSDAFA